MSANHSTRASVVKLVFYFVLQLFENALILTLLIREPIFAFLFMAVGILCERLDTFFIGLHLLNWSLLVRYRNNRRVVALKVSDIDREVCKRFIVNILLWDDFDS